jgi:sugar lactone lactonase YvrE
MKIQNMAILIILLFTAAFPVIVVRDQLQNTTLPPDSSASSGPPTNCVKGVTCDGRGNCWFATWSGVSVRDRFGNWTEFTPSSGKLADPYNYDVAVDSSGYAWITHHNNGVSLAELQWHAG